MTKSEVTSGESLAKLGYKMGALVTISLNHLLSFVSKEEVEKVFTVLKPTFFFFFSLLNLSYNSFSGCDELFSADVILTFYHASIF